MLVVTSYILLLSRGKLEWGGSAPDKKTLGVVKDNAQRSMEQSCTGVVITPLGTWLVGHREESLSEIKIASGVKNLAQLLEPDVPKKGNTTRGPSSAGIGGLIGLGQERDEVSVISRLNPGGVFEPVAVVPETACLRATPDGQRVFLLTGLKQPEKSDSNGASGPQSQTVVFESNDQGATWQWRKQGFFPQKYLAWDIQPYFFNTRSVWVWTDEPGLELDPSAQPEITTLQYSPDGGNTIETVRSARPLVVPFEEIRAKVPDNARWGDNADSSGRVSSHIVQFSDQRAVAWVSQEFLYSLDDGPYLHIPYSITTQATLERVAGQWQVGKVSRIEGFAVKQILGSKAGQALAVVQRASQPTATIETFDPTRLQWEKRGELPNAFAPLHGSSYVREAYLGSKALVVNVGSTHEVPRLIYPWRRDAANVSGNAVFYSTDLGRSWSRLAIDGYLGLLGMDEVQNRVIWAEENRYSNRSLQVHSYGLSP